MLADKNPYINEAVQELARIAEDSELGIEYFRCKMVIMDYNTQMAYAREEGEAKGRAEGRAEGKINKAIEIAKNMIEIGFSISDIAKATDLDADMIRELQANIVGANL